MQKVVTCGYDYIDSRINPLLKEGWIIKSIVPFPVMTSGHGYDSEIARAVFVLERNEEVKL